MTDGTDHLAGGRTKTAAGAETGDASESAVGAEAGVADGARVDGRDVVAGRPLTQREQLAFLKKRGFISARQEKKLRKALQRQREAIDRESRRLLALQAEVLGLKF